MESRDSHNEREFIVIIFLLLAANVKKMPCHLPIINSLSNQFLPNGSKSRNFVQNKVNVFPVANHSREHSSLECFTLM